MCLTVAVPQSMHVAGQASFCAGVYLQTQQSLTVSSSTHSTICCPDYYVTIASRGWAGRSGGVAWARCPYSSPHGSAAAKTNYDILQPYWVEGLVRELVSNSRPNQMFLLLFRRKGGEAITSSHKDA